MGLVAFPHQILWHLELSVDRLNYWNLGRGRTQHFYETYWRDITFSDCLLPFERAVHRMIERLLIPVPDRRHHRRDLVGEPRSGVVQTGLRCCAARVSLRYFRGNNTFLLHEQF